MFDPSLALPLSLGIMLAGFLLRSRRARTGLLFLAFLVQVRYLLWRGLFTLDTATSVGLAVTGTLFVAELYGLLQNLFFYHQATNPHERTPPEPARYPTVDIFVPIVNEPLVILKRTLIGCRAQDYPEDRLFIHVLDDGGRDEVRKLAGEMGCTYHRREDRAHAKAGNLNYALGRTGAEMVAVFDVDHVPVRNFLMRTVGCFRDERVAFVQTPHHFYNPDIYQRNLRLERDIRNDQDLFFKVIQHIQTGGPGGNGRVSNGDPYRGPPHEPAPSRKRMEVVLRKRDPLRGALPRKPAVLSEAARAVDHGSRADLPEG
jgi:cellulose synthase (UDP-forming)